MRIFILSITLHACLFMGFSQDLSTPAASVNAFIQAYESWNNQAIQLKKEMKPEDLEAINAKIGAGFNALIQQFCIPDFKPQSYSYGSEARHRVEAEKIVKEEVEEQSAILTTHSGTEGKPGFAQYQYHLQKVGDQWRRAQR